MRHLKPRPTRGILLTLLVGCSLFLAACSDAENNRQNALKPRGPAAERIDNLFVPIFWVAVAVGVFVLAGVLFVAFRFRYREGRNDNPKQIHGSTPLEIGWTIAPALILAVIAVPTIKTIFDLQEAPAAGTALEVEAVGKQWWWEFKYEKVDGPDVVTADELVIPTGQPVRVHLSACDDTLPGECNVLHSFWVPELAGKTDVVPGRDNRTTIEADEPGTYLGQCAEYCGLSHANMRFRVIAMSPADFDRWVREQQDGPAVPLFESDGTTAAGAAQELVATKYECINCHVLDNSSTFSYGPNLTHLASRTTFASGYYPLNRENLIDWVLDAPSMIPMQSKECRLTTPAADNECVGMPSFVKDTPKGFPVMTRAEAEQIADYLLELT